MSRHKYYQFVQLLVFALVLLACEVDEEKRPPISIFSQKHSFLIGDNLFDIQMVNLIASEKHSNAIVPCASEESSVKGYCGLQYAEIKRNMKTKSQPFLFLH